jgi:hypothetical protein
VVNPAPAQATAYIKICDSGHWYAVYSDGEPVLSGHHYDSAEKVRLGLWKRTFNSEYLALPLT